MNVTRREKYTNGGRTVAFTKRKITINYSLDVLNIMCSYVISTNRNIRRGQLINMRNLFEIIDINTYINDPEKMNRINFIRKGLEGRIIHNLKEPVLIVKYINGGLGEADIIDINNFAMLTSDQLEWITQNVSTTLKFSFINNDIDRMLDICTRFKSGDYTTMPSVVAEFEALINDIQAKFRRVKVETASEMSFTLRDGLFQEVVNDIFDQITNPCNKLVTGMQGLNELLGGGFEGGREYMFLGLAGTGKSLTLLDLSMQIKKYNKNYKPKDPTKIPVVVYLTMENSVRESVQRLFEMSVGKGEMSDYSIDEVISMLRNDGELYLTDESPIDIVIKYMPNRSVDTSYLYTLTEDLEDEGYEVIALIQDHVKRIRATTRQSDIRLELGDVVNEMHSFAVIKDIPVITVSHLNRDAASKVDEASRSNKADLVRLLGRANTGESLLMLDNVDAMFLLSQEFDCDGNKYMGLSRVKNRYKASNRTTIFLPYLTGENSIKLVEDYYSQIPTFKDTLRQQANETAMYNNGIKKSPYQPQIKDIDALLSNDNKEEKNLFDNVVQFNNFVPLQNIMYKPQKLKTVYHICEEKPQLKTVMKKVEDGVA